MLSKHTKFIAGAILTIVVVGGWFSQPNQLPVQMGKKGQSLILLDRNGQLLRSIPNASGYRRSFLELEIIPVHLQQAFILAEDQRFYEHSGVDGRSLARALWQNMTSGRRVSGASTLTMQAARMAFGLGHGYFDKLRQVIIAWRIESSHKKGEILEYYLNHVPFGGMAQGVAEACHIYFNSECQRLSLAQATTLAVLVRAPTTLLKNKQALQHRRDLLLTRYANSKLENATSINAALNEPLDLSNRQSGFYAPHFTEWVRLNLPKSLSGKIRTTLDATIQRDVQSLVKHHVDRLRKRNVNTASVIVIENKTGRILTYVGSPDYSDNTNNGKLDYVQTKRQPGSTIKPFTYSLALQHGYTLSTILPDLPSVFTTEAGPYKPKNYSGQFTGPRRLRESLANSLNIPALHIAIEVGPDRLLHLLHDLGISSLDKQGNHYGPGLTLGNGEVSLFELTRAYMVLARNGKAIDVNVLQGMPVIESNTQVIPEKIAYLVSETLKDPISREDEFGRYNSLSFRYPVAAKTGTSSDYRDNWVIGYTGLYTIGVWVGHDSALPMKHVSGITGAGPLFHDVVNRVMQGKSKRWLKRPKGLISQRICPLSGSLAGPNCKSSITESFRKEHALNKYCEYHQTVAVHDCKGETREVQYIQLPSQYSDWQINSSLPSLKQVLDEECDGHGVPGEKIKLASNEFHQARIIEPLDGSYYAMDPAIPTENQKLAIRMILPIDTKEVDIVVNGETINIQKLTSNVWLWPMQKGQQKIYAKIKLTSGQEIESQNVSFKVF